MDSKIKILTLDGAQCKYIERASANKETYDSVTGILNHIQENSYEWDGETKHMLELAVAGNDGLLYFIRGKKHTKIMLDFLNRLATINDLLQPVKFIPYRQTKDGYNQIRGGIRYGTDLKTAELKYPDMDNAWPSDGRVKKLLGEVQAKLTKIQNEITMEEQVA